MAHCYLLSLPNEIKFRVIDELDPEDLGSLVLSNKTFYDISQSAILQHQTYLKEYSVLHFGDPGSWQHDWVGDHVLLFLKEILQNPRITYYPKSIHIAEWDYDNEDEENLPEERDGVISSCGTQLAALGADNPWLSESRRDQWRNALLQRSNQGHHLAVLLTLLPNLQSIALTDMSFAEDGEAISEMVWAVAAANRDPMSPCHGKALSKLRKISVDHADTENGEEFAFYAPFIALPSVRAIHGRMIDGDFAQRELHPERFGQALEESLRPEQIEEIDIEYSAIDLNSWQWILSSIVNLRKFIYHHGGTNVGCADYDCGGIVALLRKHASHSLVKLDLTADPDMSGDTIDGNTGDFTEDILAGNLNDFKKLRVLRLDDTAFQKPKQGEIVRLLDMLPASIRVVRLLREIQKGDPADLFVGLAEGKKERLPKLKKISLEGYFDLSQAVVDELKDAGIEITGNEM